MIRVGVIGGGAFGSAMACVMRRAGHETVLWAREPFTVQSINRDRMNPLYLPRVRLESGIRATNELADAVTDMDFLLLAVPAQFLRSVAEDMRALVVPGIPVVNCAKGIERGTCALMPEVIAQSLPEATVACLSGPAFARELAADLPTGVTFACENAEIGEKVSRAIATPRFCTYLSEDVPGTAVGGAVKNVLAIACGIAEGRKLGANARATLITRGLAEMARLGFAKGARLETFMGLSGIGDLTLTCNNVQSRNMSLGVALGEGKRLADVLGARREVTEGAYSAEAIAQLAARLNIAMPIVTAVDRVLNHDADLDASVSRLIAHPWHHEGVFNA
ncbi:MAG: NAD(P)-dependent glycerol-3-phosphate dehydrogenase [Betaproteobacteria bacterium]|nr:MAG: NAD(P)-dependent glycerol-3-phosphate dehydrogenase [Betaproteobacteria bacterium]